jgi:hypothetical protein
METTGTAARRTDVSVVDDEDGVFKARCAEAPDGWPFDADRDDPLTAHRIAVTSSHPGWRHVVAFDREPTDAEVARTRCSGAASSPR